MKDKIENAGSVEEMFAALGNACGNPQEEEGPQPVSTNEIKDAVLIAAAQSFLQIMPRFLQLAEDDQKEFIGALTAYHTPTVDPLTRNTAFYTLYEYLFGKVDDNGPTRKSDKEIVQCEESNTPCEECETTPTHRVKFMQNNRTEEHFLCQSCETGARRDENV